MLQKTYELSQFLETVLGPELHELLSKIHDGSGYFKLPDTPQVMQSPQEVSRVVALASNKYAEAVRFAGIARAQYKIAEANYKYKFRTNLGAGKNQSEREAKAMDAAQTEYEQMIYLSSVVELAESVESSCRIASESARRMLLGSQQSDYAGRRYDQNSESLKETDFVPF
jgi:hypothetical protein